MEEDQKKIKIQDDPLQKKVEDDLKKKDNLKKKTFSIPPKFRGKPFLGLAQLSKILYVFYYCELYICYSKWLF
jgi:hypothetical protein